MNKGTIDRWRYRWGIVGFPCTTWTRPGHWLTKNGRRIGLRTARRGWILMPLHHRAIRKGRA